MVIAAVEQAHPEGRRLVRDPMAYQFLPAGLKLIVKLARWPLAGELLFRASERRSPGVWGGILCRKRYIDEKLIEALGTGIGAVVNLGAGLDTRAYRLPPLSKVPVFEVDLPENIEYKKSKLQQLFGGVPSHVVLVPVDFLSQDLESVMQTYGYQAGQSSFFIWEGVTQYLPEPAVRKTFEFLANASAGSRMVFTYIRKDFIEGTSRYGLEALYQASRGRGQWWWFGLQPEQVAAFLIEFSWRELEQAGSREYTEWYLQPAGRSIQVMEIERAVYAGRS